MKKSVFITGLSREMGLGVALARNYLAQGNLVFGSLRNIDQPHIKELKEKWGDMFIPVAMDLTNLESVKAAAANVAKISKIDILIGNATAADAAGNKPIDDGCSTENMLNAYDVNAVGFIRMVQAFLTNFAEAATIASISSEAGSMGKCWRDDGLDYGMAKAALNFACVTLQRRLAPKYGYRVLAIHPGWVQTRPAPPKANLTPEESAEHIVKTIESPPEYEAIGNKGVFIQYDGAEYGF
ncbi:MAG: SDR family NAD(P)-dependent oxidoreductase [Lachnospiraceae bacterium]|nr:SDR family NAD(P)-dependent oxidoreductase [Lachnospiraceae bacterium]